jgi:hypothetical protein
VNKNKTSSAGNAVAVQDVKLRTLSRVLGNSKIFRSAKRSTKGELLKAGAAVTAGAGAGAITAGSIGGIGMVVGGVGLSVGAMPIIVAGGIVGLAGYGLYRLFSR